MMDDDIVRIPPMNIRLGSCPECGKPIWESDAVMTLNVFNEAVYKCVECKRILSLDDIIPF